jgi:hypothetical protein
MHFKPDIDRLIENTAISIVLASFLFMISGCHYYRVISKVPGHPETIMTEITGKIYPETTYPRDVYPESYMQEKLLKERRFYLLDSTNQWYLSNPELRTDTIYAVAIKIPRPPSDKSNYYVKRGKYDPSTEKEILQRINLFVDTMYFSTGDTIFFPVSSIIGYDIYKIDNGPYIGLTFAILGGLAVTTVAILIIVALANIVNG